MTGGTVVIGIGNEFRRDDAVGPTVAQRIAERSLPGVRVVSGVGEPTALLDVWSDAALAIVIDAVTGPDPAPGRIRRWTGSELEPTAAVSSHALGLAQTCALGHALARMPDELILFTVDVVDTNQGIGLTPAVGAAVAELADLIVDEVS